jgi:hypothetical protein
MEEINVQIHNPDEYECDIQRFSFQRDNVRYLRTQASGLSGS